MTTGRKLKILFIVALVLFSGMVLVPQMPQVEPNMPEWWKKYCAPAGIKLGLDLKGGLHVVLRVDRDKALENALDFAANDFKNILAEKGVTAVRLDSGSPHKVLFTLPNAGVIDPVKSMLYGVTLSEHACGFTALHDCSRCSQKDCPYRDAKCRCE